jgi:hypothetical protein
MENIFLRDALYSGFTGNGFKYGTVLGRGWFWFRVEGCMAFYRGADLRSICFSDVIFVCDKESEVAEMPADVSHDPGAYYTYLCQKINGAGDSEHTFSACLRLVFDEEGAIAADTCNAVKLISIHNRDGKVELCWFYDPCDQRISPAGFGIYWDAGSGVMDYENAIGDVRYRGRRFYFYTSDGLDEGRYTFSICVYDSLGNVSGGLRKSIAISQKMLPVVSQLSAELF